MFCEFRYDLGTILAVFLGLVLFGVWYNTLVGWLERRGYTEGYLSLVVVGGVGVTLIGVAILSIPAALLTLGGFIASGIPMIIGSFARYLKRRDEAKKLMIKEAQDDRAA